MAYVTRKLGLRVTVMISIVGTAIGTWIKFIAVNRSLIALVIIAQGLIAHFQIVASSSTTQISAIWFESSQVSLASSLAFMGTMSGLAFVFLLTPIFVENNKNIEKTYDQFYNYQLGNALIATIAAIIICICKENNKNLIFLNIPFYFNNSVFPIYSF